MKRSTRMATATETLEIVKRGAYVNRHGTTVAVSDAVTLSVRDTRVVRPTEWEAVIAAGNGFAGSVDAHVEVTGETTLAAAHRLAVIDGHADTAALNFASAKNAGGGFRNGAQAQEESLARSSALYASLLAAPAYYAANRAADLLYTDHAILSPRVPVFRDDDGNLLDAPYPATFITMPAANIGAMPADSPLRASVPATMVRRARCVLALAATAGCRSLILGAWGCGVFRNDPAVVADAVRPLADGRTPLGGDALIGSCSRFSTAPATGRSRRRSPPGWASRQRCRRRERNPGRAGGEWSDAMPDVTMTDAFVFFWAGWPSQWHPCTFTVDGVTYTCAEQFMMAEKAALFGDDAVRAKVLASTDPRKQKALGRQVRNFDHDRWTAACRDVVHRGNLAKFGHDAELRGRLLATGDRRLVEASPVDRIWGIGLAADDPRAADPSQWRGTNWLGEALDRVRQALRDDVH